MVRLLLVVTLLALGAAGWISFDKVQTRIDGLETDLTLTQNRLSDAETAQANAEKERDDFKNEADAAKATASR